MATSLPATVSFWTIPAACCFACWPSFGFRSSRNGANAPGHTTSTIATSIDDECVENALASCEYDASEAAGCGTTLTLMPVSFVNRPARAKSRWWPPPTESPTKVIDWPPYFALIAAAFGTGGAAMAVVRAARLVLADAMLSETTSARRLTRPAQKTRERGLTLLILSLEHAWGAERLELGRDINTA